MNKTKTEEAKNKLPNGKLSSATSCSVLISGDDFMTRSFYYPSYVRYKEEWRKIIKVNLKGCQVLVGVDADVLWVNQSESEGWRIKRMNGTVYEILPKNDQFRDATKKV